MNPITVRVCIISTGIYANFMNLYERTPRCALCCTLKISQSVSNLRITALYTLCNEKRNDIKP